MVSHDPDGVQVMVRDVMDTQEKARKSVGLGAQESGKDVRC